ncbi:MAG TPA: hypothetical protein VF698_06925 [Thermoanaerobaculia bacterium]
MRLDPYLLVVAPRERASRAIIVLRAGGYQVTKLAEPAHMLREVARMQPDGVVLDLPPMQANRLVQELRTAAPHVPAVVVTSAPMLVDARTVSRAELATELITAVDRMLVDAMVA